MYAGFCKEMDGSKQDHRKLEDFRNVKVGSLVTFKFVVSFVWEKMAQKSLEKCFWLF